MEQRFENQGKKILSVENFQKDPSSTDFFSIEGLWNKKNDMKLSYHDFHQIIFVEKGVFILYDGKYQQPLYKGAAAFIPVGYPHRIYNLQNSISAKTSSVYFNSSFMEGMDDGILIFTVSELIESLIKEITGLEANEADDINMKCVALLVELIKRETEQPRQRIKLPVSNDERIQKSVDFMQLNFSRKITLTDIAGTVCLSTRQFSRLFTDKMGVTPFEYLRMYRIISVLPTLSMTKENILDSIYQSGYETVSSFYKDFTQFIGMPPGAFRKNHNLYKSA